MTDPTPFASSPVDASTTGARALGDGSSQAKIVEVLATKVWIENGMFGERAVMVQHDGMEPFEYAVFNYRYGYTDNLSTLNAAERLARTLGAGELIEYKQRGLEGAALHAVPEGWVSVPRVPTEAMLPYLCNCDVRIDEELRNGPTEACYRAMIAAAPSPTEAGK